MNPIDDPRTFIFQVNPVGSIVFANDDWLAFGQENDSPMALESLLNTSLWESISDIETCHVYELLMEKVCQTHEHIYLPFRCDSASCRRYMQMEISCVSPELIQFKSWMLKEEKREPVTLLNSEAKRLDTFLTICSWCKKVQMEDKHWEEVEEAVKKLGLFSDMYLPKLTHGVCPVCKESILEQHFNE